jgi:type II secretory pathway component PulK
VRWAVGLGEAARFLFAAVADLQLLVLLTAALMVVMVHAMMVESWANVRSEKSAEARRLAAHSSLQFE